MPGTINQGIITLSIKCRRVYSDEGHQLCVSHFTLQHFKGPKDKGVARFCIALRLVNNFFFQFFFPVRYSKKCENYMLPTCEISDAASISFFFTSCGNVHFCIPLFNLGSIMAVNH